VTTLHDPRRDYDKYELRLHRMLRHGVLLWN